MNRAIALLLAALVAAAPMRVMARTPADAGRVPAFAVGADLSSLARVEGRGSRFHAGTDTLDALRLLARAGFTSARLRLWHTPAAGEGGDLPTTLALARRAREAGMSWMLDLHASDTWADPAHQRTPAAWRSLATSALADSLRAWTRAVTHACVAAGTPPAWVQIGNEIDGGWLWDDGRVGGAFDTPAQWAKLGALLRAAARGVREGAPHARIVVHLAAGDTPAAVRFVDHLRAANVDYDVLAISYYPWWHGSLEALRERLATLSWRSGRPVCVVETAYPWTTHGFDDTRNLVGDGTTLLPAYAATPAGQAAFAKEVRRIVASVPEGRGVGVWWWEPAWIATRGTASAGSPWENCALFDSAGAVLPALGAFAP